MIVNKKVVYAERKWKRRPRMGRVKGGARAAFATPSRGPSHIKNYILKKKLFDDLKRCFLT